MTPGTMRGVVTPGTTMGVVTPGTMRGVVTPDATIPPSCEHLCTMQQWL